MSDVVQVAVPGRGWIIRTTTPAWYFAVGGSVPIHLFARLVYAGQKPQNQKCGPEGLRLAPAYWLPCWSASRYRLLLFALF
jgi:hypothetical protein